MKNYYKHYKNLHDSIKPIRGRAEEVRPIVKRSRDHERIEMSGDVVACRLYDTQCVRYYPDGRIGLRCNTWSTPLTAEFIHTHSPWLCVKRNKKLWVHVQTEDGYKYYPIPDNGELQFQSVGERWAPVGDVVIQKQVINREKAKAVRAPYKPFLDWAKVFLKMSDGWIMHSTREQGAADSLDWRWRPVTSEILERAASGDDRLYLRAMCEMLRLRGDASEWKFVRAENHRHPEKGFIMVVSEYFDMRFSYEVLKRKLYDMIEKTQWESYYDTIRVEPQAHTMSGIV